MSSLNYLIFIISLLETMKFIDFDFSSFNYSTRDIGNYFYLGEQVKSI